MGKPMLRTLLILAAVLPLAACDDDNTDAKRPTRIICQDAGGRTVVDDFATDGTNMEAAAMLWDSATQHGTMRATGHCVSYPQERPADWKPVIPGK